MTAHAQIKALKDYDTKRKEALVNNIYDTDYCWGRHDGKDIAYEEFIEDLERCLLEHEGL